MVVRLDDYVQRGVILEATASLYEGDDAEPFFEQSYHESGKHWHDLTADLGRHVKTDVFNLLIERTSNSP